MMQFLMSRLQASAISWSSFRLQELTWIADRDRAREGVDMLDGAEHFFNGHAQHRLVDHPQNEDALEDLAEGLQGMIQPVLL